MRRAFTHLPPGWRLGVFLNSAGGDVDAAIRLGRLFREARAQVWVSENCVSACVLAFAGGVVRTNFNGKVGIHRPALAVVPKQLDMNFIRRSTDEVILRLRAYAKDMNVNDRLIDDMLVIPPENVRWLSQEDLNKYGLGHMDPVYAEMQVLEGAKKYGITPGVYRARDQIARYKCWTMYDEGLGWFIPKRDDCADKVLSGTP